MYKNTDKINYKLHHFFYAFFIFAEIYEYTKKKCIKKALFTQHFFVFICHDKLFQADAAQSSSPCRAPSQLSSRMRSRNRALLSG